MNPFDLIKADVASKHQSHTGDVEYIWVRMGWGDEMERFDTIADADFDILFSSGSEISKWRTHGFEVSPVRDEQNFISCFIGDEHAHPMRDLNKEERALVERLVAQNTPAMAVAQ